MPDPFDNPHVRGALYLSDLGDYIFRYKEENAVGAVVVKNLREPEVSAAFTRQGSDSGWIAPGIIRAGASSKGPWYVYRSSPDVRRVRFYDNEEFVVPVPSLVLISAPKGQYLFALMGDIYEMKNLTVYHAPFPNVHPDGKICWGNTGVPGIDQDQAQKTLDRFFESAFNGDMVSDKSQRHRQDVRKQLEKVAGKRRYPVSDLVSTGFKLEEALTAIIERRRA